jgi:hypothetical protein
LKIHDLVWNKHKIVVGLKPVNGGSTPPLYCFTSLVIVETIDILSCFTVFVPSYDLNIQRSPLYPMNVSDFE